MDRRLYTNKIKSVSINRIKKHNDYFDITHRFSQSWVQKQIVNIYNEQNSWKQR